MIFKLKYIIFRVNFIFILLSLVLTLSLGFNQIKTDYFNNSNQINYDYFGTNSLFIEIDNGLKFYWITTNDDVGVYELISSGNTIISKGNTAKGRVHNVFVDYNIKENVIFKFGGQNESTYEVKLRPKYLIITRSSKM